MVRLEGFEPATYRLEGGCSIQLSYRRVLEQVMGIEPTSPAWKAGALAVVLHLQIIQENVSLDMIAQRHMLVKVFAQKSPAAQGSGTEFHTSSSAMFSMG